MASGSFVGLTIFATVGAALSAGAFFAFSGFVMPALARLSPAQGIAAMQSINVTAISPAFMLALFGPALASLPLGARAAMTWDRPGSAWLLAGCAIYLIGSVGVTIAFNVPRNDALAAVDPTSDAGAVVWADYLRTWTAWNHVRTVASALAAAAWVAALLARPVDVF